MKTYCSAGQVFSYAGSIPLLPFNKGRVRVAFSASPKTFGGILNGVRTAPQVEPARD